MPTIIDPRHNADTRREASASLWMDAPTHPEQTAYELLIAGGDSITVAEAATVVACELAFLEASHGRSC